MNEIIIRTFNLTRKFGKLIAINSINLEVPKGAVYGFLGPNGAGKTTTIRLLLGLIQPDEGKVFLFNTPVNRQSYALFNRIGALVESPSLYLHLTGYENLEITRRIIDVPRKEIDTVLSMVNLDKNASHLAGQYSQGMRQRLGLALALLNKPDLLILDEPINGLDPAGIRWFKDLVLQSNKEYNVTFFISTHILSEIEEIASHIGVISNGKLLFQGSLDKLRSEEQANILLEVDRLEDAKELLKKAGWSVQSSGEHRIVIIAHDYEDTAKINAFLFQQGFEVTYLKLEKPSLEQKYLQLIHK